MLVTEAKVHYEEMGRWVVIVIVIPILLLILTLLKPSIPMIIIRIPLTPRRDREALALSSSHDHTDAVSIY